MNLLKALFSQDVENTDLFEQVSPFTNDFIVSLQESWQENTDDFATVRSAIDPGQLGRVRFHGVWWRACSDRAQSIPEGTQVRVLGRRSNILVVEAV